MEGSKLHGHAIPDSFQIVAIENIEEKISPLFITAFDGQFLEVGGITAWPNSQCVPCES